VIWYVSLEHLLLSRHPCRRRVYRVRVHRLGAGVQDDVESEDEAGGGHSSHHVHVLLPGAGVQVTSQKRAAVPRRARI